MEILPFCLLLDLLVGTAGVGPQRATSARARGERFCCADNLSGLGTEGRLHPSTALDGLV